MSITICDTHLTRTVRYLSLTFEPVYSPTKVAISTRPLRQYYDTEKYQRLQHDFE